MRAGHPKAFLVAIFGADKEEAEQAFKLLKAGGIAAWLASPEDSADSNASDPLQLASTLLQGEHLIVAQVPPEGMDTAVRQLGSVGAPALFVLPEEVPGLNGWRGELPGAPVPSAALPDAIEALAQRHGEPRPCVLGESFFSLLSQDERRLESIRNDIVEAARLDNTLSPAAEWLIDNGYLFDVHIAEVRKNLLSHYHRILPATAGNLHHPRVYELAVELVQQTDSSLTADNIAGCLRVYQSLRVLTMAELWSFPQMLRFAVLQGIVSTGGKVQQSHRLRQFSHFWANRLTRAARTDDELLTRIMAHMERQPYALDPDFVTSLTEQLRDEPTAAAAVQLRVESSSRLSIADIVRREHQEETANRVSIANAVASLRQLERLEYHSVFESASEVDRILRDDPAGCYDRSDFPTRDRCRHGVEQISRTGPLDEFEVARRTVQLARMGASPVERNVSYYLIGDGRERLEKECKSRPLAGARFLRFLRRRATPVYLFSLVLLTLSFLSIVVISAREFGAHPPATLLLLSFLALFPLSELAIQIVNTLIFRFFPPDELPRLALREGIPVESATLVVIPMMFSSLEGVDKEVAKLEVRYLGNRERHLYFALFPDFLDSTSPSEPEDDVLFARASDAIHQLNLRHGPKRFFLFHRKRTWSECQQVWMGRERKRGKIEDLNALLLGEPSEAEVNEPLPEAIRYVITLDADTQLPLETAKRMVATVSHPLNQVELTPDGRNRVRGYAIVQPRVSIGLPGATATRFTRIFGDASGTDPYCRAVSNAYQDLFREGLFLGKAIYDLRAFHAILNDRFPSGLLLSHDLIEGSHVGVASASGIEIFENMPVDFSSASRRQHRWIRGDWQIAEWIAARVPDPSGTKASNVLTVIARWRILDNLRRSLVAPATVLLLIAGWFGSNAPGVWTLLIAAAITMPGLAPLSERLAHRLGGLVHGLQGAWEELLRPIISISLLPHQAWTCLDAIVRTLHRRLVSRRRLLEWQTAEQADSQADDHQRRTIGECIIISAVSFVLLLLLSARGAFWSTAPVLVLWLISPLTVIWLAGRIERSNLGLLEGEDSAFLLRTARRTWRFFDDLVGPADHWLPPDNTQLALKVEVAHRTSPTNIGLWLTSALAAHDLGFITTDRLVSMCAKTVDSLSIMERYEGHWLNWYNTTSLEPLAPRYISTVDSGNLLASFWVIEQGFREIENAPVLDDACLRGLTATVLLLSDVFGEDHSVRLPLKALERLLRRPAEGQEIGDHLLLAAQPVGQLAATRRWQPIESNGERDYWIAKLDEQLSAWSDHLKRYLPWLDTLAAAPDPFLKDIHPELVAARRLALSSIPSLSELAGGKAPALRKVLDLGANASQGQHRAWIEQIRTELERSRQAAAETLRLISETRGRVRTLSETVDMGFLYDANRHLMGIGYQVGGPVQFAAHYDLLASECRLASLVAIAKGDVPLEHWRALGRPYVSTPEGQSLLSWNGTMFEYLMPLVYMRAFENSFLASACNLAVRKQMEYADQKGIPWGISEAAYSALDAQKTYQYRAFGVPSLGLKEGLENDLVVSPYSTFLALQVLPRESVDNLETLASQGMSGSMGLYESLDYTRERTRRGGRGVIVYAYMAHHQGMCLLAMNNVLNGQIMQRRFHSDPRIQSVESLLYEGIPAERSLLRRSAPDAASLRVPSEPETSQRSWQEDSPVPSVNLLGNGHYTLMVTSSGSGFSRWRQFDLTAWSADTTQDRMGTYFYIQDRRSGAIWSATHQPLAGNVGTFSCNFSADRAEFVRRVSDVETITAICVSSEVDVEVRRLTFTNHGLRTRNLELTSYCELALAPHAAHSAHPVFSKLFVQTEVLFGGQALIAHRRPRSPEDPPVWMAHMVVAGPYEGAVQYETSRAAFLGRGHSTADPVATSGQLSQSTGSVLDPVFSLRCRFTLEARGRIEISFLTLAAGSRDELLALVERFRHPEAVPRAFETAWTQAQLEFRYLGIKSATAHRFQELLSPLIYPHEGLRPAKERLAANRLGQDGLWAHGLSGDLPILVVTVAESRGVSLVRDLLLAREYWQMRGFSVDLVVFDQEPYSYDRPLMHEVGKLVSAHRTHSSASAGGVFLLDWNTLNEESRTLLLAAAHAVLGGNRGSLAQQLAAASDSPAPPAPLAAEASRNPETSSELPFLELPYFNGLGGFTPDGREYAIYLKARDTTPAPWSNVIAAPRFGTVVTESGLGFTWFGNSQSNRLTPWQNDPVCDPQAEIIYIRDQESGAFWTPTPRPIREATAYRARHGQGYTVYEHNSHAIRQELTVFIPLDDSGGEPVKILRLRLHNEDSRRRSLSVTWYVEWVLGVSREESQRHVQTSFDVDSASLVAGNVWQPSYGNRVAFVSMGPRPQSWTGDRTAFLGRNGLHASPDAMKRVRLDGRVGPGLDPAGAVQAGVVLEPGQALDVICMLGQGADRAEVRSLVSRYRNPEEVTAALERTRRWWDTRLSKLQVRVPVLSVAFLLNRWLPYQVLSCRYWARSAFYQSGGAFGFRDQLQDSMGLVYWAPEMAREHLLTAASRQFPQGDVQHWWHVETGAGPRTRCSDDMLWLAFATAHYVKVTGDESVLREAVPYLDGPELEPGQDEHLFTPVQDVSRGASLFDHCCRSIERAHSLGAHGIPLFGSGDWNDGMNRVGAGGTGESVWLAWFLAAVLREFAPLAARFGNQTLADSYQRRSRDLVKAIDAGCWDGEWYLRGFFDDGTPLGSRSNMEARIDSMAQSWAVLAGGGDPDRARIALQSAVRMLVRPDTRQVLLFTPAFDKSTPHPGYIMGYPPGIRENGGQYTHGSLWLPAAFAALGLGSEAFTLLQLMNPAENARDLKTSARYGGEPYVSPADVYSSPTHAGRCGWTWYTGSASWAYRIWLESILGFRLQGDHLSIVPALPAAWNDFELDYTHGEAQYHIKIQRDPAAVRRLVKVNGQKFEGDRIPLVRTPSQNEIVVLLPGQAASAEESHQEPLPPVERLVRAE